MTHIPKQLWVFQAQPIRVVDGDTLDVVIDSGFRGTRTERLRLLGVNCPETRGPTQDLGREAATFTGLWIHQASAEVPKWPLVIETRESDVFGRYLARVWRVSDGRELNEDLIANGFAVEDIRKGPEQ